MSFEEPWEERITIDTLRLVAEIMEKRIYEGSFMRIPETLQMGGEAYNPRFVSIGPFHYPDANRAYRDSVSSFVAMEANKQLYMLKLLEETPSCEVTLESCWNFIIKNKERIKDCYSEETIKSSISLSRVMLVDGCFLLYFLLHGDTGDGDLTLFALRRDLILLENQIPFFVLEGLLESFSDHLGFLPRDLAKKVLQVYRLSPHVPQLPQHEIVGESQLESYVPQCIHFLDLIGKWYDPEQPRNDRTTQVRVASQSKGVYLRSATKLKAIGMIFQCDTECKLLDITLSGEVLRIPTLIINDYTEALLKNLVTYEHVSPKSKGYFTSYLCFMSHLIENLNDVKILESAGIIENRLGNKKDASRLFSVMDEKLWLKDFYYRNLCDDIEAYARSRWQKHKRVLKKRYFRSKWTIFSVFAATTNLLLALLQTIYSIMSYYQSL